MAEQRTEKARQESAESAAEVDDLDNLNTPEMIMLSAVSGEDAQDRSDRKILMPWVKFLWESYCQCLELLRTNLRVERLYHDIAQQAFRFCLKYQVSSPTQRHSNIVTNDYITVDVTQISQSTNFTMFLEENGVSQTM